MSGSFCTLLGFLRSHLHRKVRQSSSCLVSSLVLWRELVLATRSQTHCNLGGKLCYQGLKWVDTVYCCIRIACTTLIHSCKINVSLSILCHCYAFNVDSRSPCQGNLCSPTLNFLSFIVKEKGLNAWALSTAHTKMSFRTQHTQKCLLGDGKLPCQVNLTQLAYHTVNNECI